MMKLLEFLWSGCFHEWETIEKKDMEQHVRYNSGRETKTNYTKYTLRCKKCGNIKHKEV